MTEPEQSTLDILLKEVLNLKEAVNELKFDKQLIDRQFRGVSASIQESAENDNWLERARQRAREITESGWS